MLIAGPTASGKSGVGLALAREFDGIVINADALQVYREPRILTARPRPEDEATVPHRLYGTVAASTAHSVGRWIDDARVELEAAWRDHRLPIVVGGTGLYFRALEQGLARVPPIPPEVRRRWRDRLAREGPPRLHEELARRNPAEARRVRPSDGQRIVRALEVEEATGRGLGDWQSGEHGPTLLAGADVLRLFLSPPRADLRERIARRFQAMVEEGAMAEAQAIDRLALDPALPAARLIGLKPLIQHGRGEIDLETACGIAIAATRQYAKRQLTWARSNMISWNWVEREYMERSKALFFNFIRLLG